MKGKKILAALGFFSIASVAGGCSQPAPEIRYQIETDQPCQTMAYFSASDAWSMQFIGLWPQEKQNQIADWLFSTENDANGQPKGIGLSLWRFNVGAGSTEQGENSQIASPWMRAECFLNPDGTYDWNKQQGQRNFLKLAKERGVNKFLAFLNSPPIYYTQNGLATNTGRGGTANLKPDCYEKYARFLADVVQGVEQHDGIKFNYICPFNEPDGHWNWVGPKQEGCPATNREIARTVRLLSREFVNRNIDTQILVSEVPEDLKVAFVYDSVNSKGWNKYESFTRTQMETGISLVAGTPEKRGKVLDMLALAIEERKALNGVGVENMKPRYIVFIDDMALLENHRIVEALRDDLCVCAFTFILVEDCIEKLPGNVEYALVDSSEFSGVYSMSDGSCMPVVFDKLSEQKFDKYIKYMKSENKNIAGR